MGRILSIFFLLATLVACEEDPSGVDNAHVGVYQLTTINGQPVPVSFSEDGGVITIVGASITLNADDTFSVAAQLRFTFGGQTQNETHALSGTYTKSGNTVTFDHEGEDEGFETATINGNVLTTRGGGDEVLVFQK